MSHPGPLDPKPSHAAGYVRGRTLCGGRLLMGIPLRACMLVRRGLRVRMGIHSGLDNPQDVSHNNISQRVIYSGGWLAGWLYHYVSRQ